MSDVRKPDLLMEVDTNNSSQKYLENQVNFEKLLLLGLDIFDIFLSILGTDHSNNIIRKLGSESHGFLSDPSSVT